MAGFYRPFGRVFNGKEDGMGLELPLILGTSSVFRREQMERLGIAFQAASPDFDETPMLGESAPQTALRLAEGKARSLAGRFPEALIVGADQVAWCDDRQWGKPMNLANAQKMLMHLSGREIEFYSAIVLLNTVTGMMQRHIDKTVVVMRKLDELHILRYLEREPDAVYCSCALKSEDLGALLIEKIESTDPNALIGLPVFRLVDFLKNEGLDVL